MGALLIMSIVISSGTQNTTLNTEHTLVSTTTAGTFVLMVDTAAMDSGDEITLRVKTKILSGGASGVVYQGYYVHSQDDPIKVSIPVTSDQEFVATLEQTSGTSRDFPWKVTDLEG